MRLAMLMTSLALAALAPIEAAAAQPSADPPKIVTTPILRTGKTITNQALKLPQGDAEVIAVTVDIPVGGSTPIHQHPWSRFVYVEQGPLRVINHDTGDTRDFPSGTLLPEAVAQWHEGQAPRSPVRLIVIDLVPPGATNMVMKTDQKM